MPPNTPHLIGSSNFGRVSTLTPGSALVPAYAFGTAAGSSAVATSDTSLGFYSSGASTIAQSYGTFIAPALWATSGISVGSSTNTGSLIPAISSTSSLVAPFVVQGSSSSFTWIAWPAAKANDIILTAPFGAAISSVSSGLIPWSHCTVAGQIEFRLSNVSTLAQNQSTITWIFTRISPF